MKILLSHHFSLVGLLFVSVYPKAMSCPAYTNKAGWYEFRECVPHKTPIKDKSSVKSKTAEEQSVHRAADYFIRLELSHLMSQSDYEGEVHFAPMVKKYLNMSAKAWQDTTEAPYTAVCDKVTLVSWRATGSKNYEFDYELLVALPPDWEKSKKFDVRSNSLKATYQFDWIDGRWKVSRAQFAPHQRFTLLRDVMTRVKRSVDVRPDSWQFDLETWNANKRKYDFMQEVNRKVCAPFEGQ